MKVAFVKDRMSTGRGADRAVGLLMNGLAERGYDMALVTLQEESTPFSVPIDRRIRIRRVAAADVAAVADGADVIVSTGTNEILLLAGATKPIVQQFHVHPATCFKWRHPWRNRTIRRALARAAAVQVLLPGHVAALPSGLRARTVVIGNAPTVLPRESGLPTSERMVAYPAALTKSKNQELLMRAFATLAQDFPGWTLELYGVGAAAETRRLNRLVATLERHTPELQDRIRFMGYRDLHEVYARCAFLAFPSRSEGFGLAIMEAAAFGKPAIGLADAPGVNELILDGQTGLLVQSTATAFADGLRQLMSNEKTVRELGDGARTFCRSRYTPERIIDSWEQLLKRFQ